MPATILSLIKGTTENMRLRASIDRAAAKYGKHIREQSAANLSAARRKRMGRVEADFRIAENEISAREAFKAGVEHTLRVLGEQQEGCERPRVDPPRATGYPVSQIVRGRRYKLKTGRMIEVLHVNRKLEKADVMYTASGRIVHPPLPWLSERIERQALLPR